MPSSAPLLICMKGHPGTGKSSLALRLAQHLRAPLVDKDDARDAFQDISSSSSGMMMVQPPAAAAGPDPLTAHAAAAATAATAPLAPAAPAPAQAVTPAAAGAPAHAGANTGQPPSTAVNWNALSYQVMFNVVTRQLLVGLSVVMDCPLSHRALYDTACKVADKAGARVFVVECMCSDEEVWGQRLELRGERISGTSQGHKPTTWSELQQLLSRYQGCWQWTEDASLAPPNRVTVDTSHMDEQQALDYVLQHLHAAGAL